ncbi:hypothetical protein [Caulobacter sp. BP25]|uniref:hypothetical protein n=1 Tax=Caulobacter sp. BP25 TaxID=2048900 RepID=UPI000C12A39A|nr:hypothetical protein [Caulobacter sp. BP25]PHY18825.1 hypothetical protein CSW59_10270 [Caulobacter sp. BP25]
MRAHLAWALGDRDDALTAAEAALTLPPTNYTSTEAYSAPSLVGALASAEPRDPAERRRAATLIKRGLPALARYALVFPIARPRPALVRGLVAAPRDPARAASALARCS